MFLFLPLGDFVRSFAETAVNIGYSCHLLTDDMVEVFTIDGDTLEAVKAKISECREKIRTQEGDQDDSINVQVDIISLNALQRPSGSADVPVDEVRGDGYDNSSLHLVCIDVLHSGVRGGAVHCGIAQIGVMFRVLCYVAREAVVLAGVT